MHPPRHNDGALQDVADEAARIRERHVGAITWQRWTCAQCGARQQMEAANTFYASGRCGECGHVTQIERCGFSLILPGSAESAAMLPLLMRRATEQPDN